MRRIIRQRYENWKNSRDSGKMAERRNVDVARNTGFRKTLLTTTFSPSRLSKESLGIPITWLSLSIAELPFSGWGYARGACEICCYGWNGRSCSTLPSRSHGDDWPAEAGLLMSLLANWTDIGRTKVQLRMSSFDLTDKSRAKARPCWPVVNVEQTFWGTLK